MKKSEIACFGLGSFFAFFSLIVLGLGLFLGLPAKAVIALALYGMVMGPMVAILIVTTMCPEGDNDA